MIMLYSKSLIIFRIFSFSLFLQEKFGYVIPPVLGYSCFNKVEFLADGYFDNNLNILLIQMSAANSQYHSGVIKGIPKSKIELNTYVYGLAQY